MNSLKHTGYAIYTENNMKSLGVLVARKMCEGWEPLGAPFVTGSFLQNCWYQAMVKKSEDVISEGMPASSSS